MIYWDSKNTYETLIKLSQLINKENKIFVAYKGNSIVIDTHFTISYKDEVFKVMSNKKVVFESSNMQLIASFVRSKLGC